MEWTVRGTVLIACNCDWGCPCNFQARPSRGFCQGGWCWDIEQGRIGDVSLDGLRVALWAKWPGAIHEGGGSAVCYFDERASEEQTAALQRLLNGELGGPWMIFRNTYTLAGPHAAAFTLEGEGYDTRLTIGDTVRLELKHMTNPVTGVDLHPEMLLPEGLVVKRASLAASAHFSVADDDVAFDHSGQYTAFGRFEYAGTA